MESDLDIQQSIEAAKTLQVSCDTTSAGWLPVVSAMVGAVVGGLSSYFGAVGAERKRSNSHAKSVQAAILAEIRALLRIMELRNYVAFAKAQRDLLVQEGPDARGMLQVRVDDGYNKVFKANLENLGLLDSEMATRIVEFYQLLQAVVSDVTPGGMLAEGHGHAGSFNEVISILEAAIAIGNEIIVEPC